jgi:large subunit ribosomal protein L7/L12
MTEKTELKNKTEVDAELSSIIDQIKGMTVLKLSELVKLLEDEFGVVAAAPVAVAAVGAVSADSAEDAEDKTFEVVLKEVGDKKIQVLKVVREITGLGLKEAKQIVDSVPKSIKDGLSKEDAEEMKKKIEEQGAVVELK